MLTSKFSKRETHELKLQFLSSKCKWNLSTKAQRNSSHQTLVSSKRQQRNKVPTDKRRPDNECSQRPTKTLPKIVSSLPRPPYEFNPNWESHALLMLKKFFHDLILALIDSLALQVQNELGCTQNKVLRSSKPSQRRPEKSKHVNYEACADPMLERNMGAELLDSILSELSKKSLYQHNIYVYAHIDCSPSCLYFLPSIMFFFAFSHPKRLLFSLFPIIFIAHKEMNTINQVLPRVYFDSCCHLPVGKFCTYN